MHLQRRHLRHRLMLVQMQSPSQFYVADFIDDAYYTKDHIEPKGAYRDAPKRAMNVMINDGGYYYDQTSVPSV